jgi:hypothetical protein
VIFDRAVAITIVIARSDPSPARPLPARQTGFSEANTRHFASCRERN